MITTVDRDGRVNAAAYGTCTRVKHEPVYVAFTANVGSDTALNVADTGAFVVNLPRFDKQSLEAVRVVGLPFAPGVRAPVRASSAAANSALARRRSSVSSIQTRKRTMSNCVPAAILR